MPIICFPDTSGTAVRVRGSSPDASLCREPSLPSNSTGRTSIDGLVTPGRGASGGICCVDDSRSLDRDTGLGIRAGLVGTGPPFDRGLYFRLDDCSIFATRLLRRSSSLCDGEGSGPATAYVRAGTRTTCVRISGPCSGAALFVRRRTTGGSSSNFYWSPITSTGPDTFGRTPGYPGSSSSQ